ncbi:hypothetical protein FRC08_003063 [Ceratobasidium sp. 394]|nr:hypothetical protein FRC08_003063 [Ceratobasidium sp. 394]
MDHRRRAYIGGCHAGSKDADGRSYDIETDSDGGGDGEAGPSKPAPAKGRKRKTTGKQDGASTIENDDGGDPNEPDLTPVEGETHAGTSVVRRSSRLTVVEVGEETSTVRVTKRQKTEVSVVDKPPKKARASRKK